MEDPKQKNPELAPQTTPLAQNTGTYASGNPEEQKPGANDPSQEHLFFQVMPQARNQGNLIQPKLQIAEGLAQGQAAKTINMSALFKKYKWFLVIGGAGVVLAIFIYFIMGKIGGGPYQEENFLNINAQPASPKSASSTPTGLTKGFTTSQDWRDKYFPNCTDTSLCGDDADPDHDGLTNLQEFKLGTDPNNGDSDQDGLSDGDEVNVFGTNPLSAHSSNDSKFLDSDYFKGGFDIGTGKKMTAAQIASLTSKMKQYQLHEPTIRTLGDSLNTIYNFSGDNNLNPQASATPVGSDASNTVATSPLDQSLAGKQDRDTRRSAAIGNIEAALIKYQADNQNFPDTNDFGTMFADIKPYLKVATNPVDPINRAPYVYSYAAQPGGKDFSLAFFSEVAAQLIAKNAADAQKDANTEQAAVYDNQRETDLDSLRTALLLYSQNNVAGNQDYVFPTKEKYKTAVVPQYISVIPKDPKTGADYNYEVSTSFNTFTLKTLLDDPPTGITGYLCNQEECQNY